MNTDSLHSLLAEVGIQCSVAKSLETVFSWIKSTDDRCRPFIENYLWKQLRSNPEISIEPRESALQTNLNMVDRSNTIVKCSREYHISSLGLNEDDVIYAVPPLLSIIELVAETRYEGIFIPSLAKLKGLDLKTVHLYVKRGLLLGVLVKDRSFCAGKKNKIVSKGIKIYLSFYKPKHIFAPDSIMDKECLSVISSYFSECNETEAPLATILQSKNIPKSSFPFFQRCISSYTPEDGLSLKVVDGTTIVVFDAKLYVWPFY